MGAGIISSRVPIALRTVQQIEAVHGLPDYEDNPVEIAALAEKAGQKDLESYLRKMAWHAMTIDSAASQHFRSAAALPSRLAQIQSGDLGKRVYPIAMSKAARLIGHLIQPGLDVDALNRKPYDTDYPFFSPTADAAVGMARLGAQSRGKDITHFDPDRTYVIGPGTIGTAIAERLEGLMGGKPHLVGSSTSAEEVPRLHRTADLVFSAVGIGRPMVRPEDVFRRTGDYAEGIIGVDVAVSQAPDGCMIGDFDPLFYLEDARLDGTLISARSGPRLPGEPEDRPLGVGPWANSNLFENAIRGTYSREGLVLPQMLGNYSLHELVAA